MYQVIGLCRFSYPALGGFQTEHESPEERARFLYADARMDERFRVFEAFTLASLRAQTDPDFTLVVVAGTDMPPPRLAQLRALLARLPQAVLRVVPPGPHRAVMQREINAARDQRPCIQFRMDDDDAVACDFVAKARAVAADLAPLIARNRLTAIDFTSGHAAQPSAAGIRAEPAVRQFWVPALAVVARAGEALTVMNFHHGRLWRFMPTLMLNDPEMFVRGVSDWSDSGMRAGPEAALLDAQGEALFRQRYGICADRVRALYQTRG